MLFAESAAVPTSIWQGYWFEVLAFAVASGALGGLIGVFRDFDIPALMRGDKLYVQSRNRLFAAIAISALSGVGGSIAVLSVLILDGKFQTPPTDPVRLSLCSLGTVAGFIGFTVLNSLARGLARRIDQQAERVTDLQRSIAHNVEQLEGQSVDSAIALGFATANQATLGNVTEEALTVAIRRVSAALDKQPTNRTVGIILGRLYRWSNNYQQAIDALGRVLQARDAARIPPDKDTGALLYNRACYHALMVQREDGQDHWSQAFADLRGAVLLDPTNVAAAKIDGDFALIMADPRFEECFREREPEPKPKPAARPRGEARRDS